MRKGILLNFLSVSTVSLVPLLNKFSLGHLNTAQAALFNAFFALLLCWLFAVASGKKLVWPKDKKIFFIGLTNAGGLICLFEALDMLGPITVGMLGRFYLIFTIGIAVAVFHERLNVKQLGMITIMFIGVMMFSYSDDLNFTSVIGIFVAVFYTLLFAVCNSMVKVLVKDYDSNSVLFGNNAVTFLCLIVYAIGTGDLMQGEWNLAGIGIVFLSSFANGFLGQLLFYESFKYIGFSIANLISSIQPVLVAIYSWPFFKIELTAFKLSGAFLIIGSIMYLSLSRSAPAPTPAVEKKATSS